jgi:hypothetical protein
MSAGHMLIVRYYSYFLTEDTARLLGPYGNTDRIRKHALFKTTDWEKLLQKRVN